MQKSNQENFMLRVISAVAVGLLAGVSLAAGQDGRSDVAVSGIGFFTKDSSGMGVSQSATNSGGFLASYRLSLGKRSAAEVDYGFTRNSQIYNNPTLLAFGEEQANVHELSGAYVFKLRRFHALDPFLLAGVGALFFKPVISAASDVPDSLPKTQGMFLYGFGANYHLRGGFGLRLQYRGLVYKATDFGVSTFTTGSWTHTAEPTLGVTFRF
jgi:outer membrane immunogenic protein